MVLEQLWNDLRFATRQFVRRPGLTLGALFALTLGLGGITTVFTLVDAVILRPLPVAAPHQLVWMRDPSFSFPVFEEVTARASMLSQVFAWNARRLQIQWSGEPESTSVLLATGGIHETLGLRPAAGRLLVPSDSGRSAADAQAVAVLSYSAWRDRFHSDPDAIGTTIRIEGIPFTIVGVTPPDFFGIAVGVPVDVTIPVTMLPRMRESERTSLSEANRSWLHIMGRLRPGVSNAEADAAFQTIWPEILRVTSEGVTPSFRPRYMKFTSGLEPGATGFSPVRVQFREALWLLFALVGLLLVVACATVANLLLAAATGRQHELALRFALGATWRRVAQQLFAEGLMLAIAGAFLGLLFSAWASDLLLRLISTSYASVIVDAAPDRRVFIFIAVAVGVSTLAFTIAPILRASRFGRMRVIEAVERHTQSPHRAWTTRVLVAAQMVVSLILLAGSALFVRNLSRLLATDVGFDRQNVLVVAVDTLSPFSALQRRDAGAPDVISYYGHLLQRLRDTPGVQLASLSFKPPISNERGSWWSTFANDGSTAPVDPGNRTYLNAISPGYFKTIGMPIAAGRDFVDDDREGAPKVMVVNASLARYHFGNESPIGRHLLMGPERTRIEIVGVVRDSAYQYVNEQRRRIAYFPYMQQRAFLEKQTLVAEVRPVGAAAGISDSLRAVIRELDPSAPVTIQSVTTRIDESLVRERLLTVIAAFLGATSLLLACGALAGLMSHIVTARTREIGLRLALGADRRSVLGLVMRQAMVIAAIGAAGGLGVTLAGGRLVTSFLSTIDPADPWALTSAATILFVTAALSGYVPARRASRVDPMVALRSE